MQISQNGGPPTPSGVSSFPFSFPFPFSTGAGSLPPPVSRFSEPCALPLPLPLPVSSADFSSFRQGSSALMPRFESSSDLLSVPSAPGTSQPHEQGSHDQANSYGGQRTDCVESLELLNLDVEPTGATLPDRPSGSHGTVGMSVSAPLPDVPFFSSPVTLPSFPCSTLDSSALPPLPWTAHASALPGCSISAPLAIPPPLLPPPLVSQSIHPPRRPRGRRRGGAPETPEAAREREMRRQVRVFKNRAAAARSNARRKAQNDALKGALADIRRRALDLRERRMSLREENLRLKTLLLM